MLRGNLFIEKIYRRWKLILEENSSSETIVSCFCQGKYLLGKNILHLTEISSLFRDGVLSDKVFWSLYSHNVPEAVKKRCLWAKTQNVKTTIEFCICPALAFCPFYEKLQSFILMQISWKQVWIVVDEILDRCFSHFLD